MILENFPLPPEAQCCYNLNIPEIWTRHWANANGIRKPHFHDLGTGLRQNIDCEIRLQNEEHFSSAIDNPGRHFCTATTLTLPPFEIFVRAWKKNKCYRLSPPYKNFISKHVGDFRVDPDKKVFEGKANCASSPFSVTIYIVAINPYIRHTYPCRCRFLAIYFSSS